MNRTLVKDRVPAFAGVRQTATEKFKHAVEIIVRKRTTEHPAMLISLIKHPDER